MTTPHFQRVQQPSHLALCIGAATRSLRSYYGIVTEFPGVTRNYYVGHSATRMLLKIDDGISHLQERPLFHRQDTARLSGETH